MVLPISAITFALMWGTPRTGGLPELLWLLGDSVPFQWVWCLVLLLFLLFFFLFLFSFWHVFSLGVVVGCFSGLSYFKNWLIFHCVSYHCMCFLLLFLLCRWSSKEAKHRCSNELKGPESWMLWRSYEQTGPSFLGFLKLAFCYLCYVVSASQVYTRTAFVPFFFFFLFWCSCGMWSGSVPVRSFVVSL